MNCSKCNTVFGPADQFCKTCGAPIAGYAPPSTNANYAPPPPSANVGGGMGSAPAPFEATVRGWGDQVVASMGLNRTGAAPGLLEKLIRGAFLDGSVYRNAAANPGDNGGALIAILIPIVAGFIGSSLLSLRLIFYHYSVVTLLVSAAIGAVGAVVSLFAMSLASQAVVQRKLSFGELFRGLAYAQSPGVLTIIPVVGGLLSLWRLMTTFVAVREISGSDVGRSIGLLAIGFGSALVISLLLTPFLLASFLVHSY